MQYDPTYQKSFTCFSNESQIKTAYLVGSLSVVTDFYSVVLPAWLLMRIKISRRQKVGLAFIFGVGFLYVPDPTTSRHANTNSPFPDSSALASPAPSSSAKPKRSPSTSPGSRSASWPPPSQSPTSPLSAPQHRPCAPSSRTSSATSPSSAARGASPVGGSARLDMVVVGWAATVRTVAQTRRTVHAYCGLARARIL